MLFKFFLEGMPDLLWHAMSFNPFVLGDFAEKCILKLVKQFSVTVALVRAKTYQKAIYRLYTL